MSRLETLMVSLTREGRITTEELVAIVSGIDLIANGIEPGNMAKRGAAKLLEEIN